MKKSLGAKTILYPTPVLLVGSFDTDGRANVMTASWGGLCCSEPPCVAVSLRKNRYSYDNLVNRGAFTVNVPSAEQVREADYVGIYSGKDEDKFKALGLSAVKSDLVDAPYVDQCPLVLECKVKHTFELGIHTQFIGEILDVKIDETMLSEKGKPDLAKLKPFCFAPSDGGYYALGERIAQSFSIGKKS